jgi:signal transduction histidine kinase
VVANSKRERAQSGLRDSAQAGRSKTDSTGDSSRHRTGRFPSLRRGVWFRTSALGLVCAAYVVLASLVVAFPRSGANSAGQVVVDAGGTVVSVDPASEAWQKGVRPGWTLIGFDAINTYYGDSLGDIRPVANAAPDTGVPIGELVPAAVALAVAALLAIARLRRTAATVAVAGTAACSTVFAARLAPVGPVAALVPIAIGADLVWSFGAPLGFRPRPTRPVPAYLARFVVPFVLLPLAAAAVALAAAGSTAAAWTGTAAYVCLAWVLVLTWRIRVASARIHGAGAQGGTRSRRFAVARAVLAEMLPFSDRFVRRGAESERERLAGDLHAELLPAIAMTASELERRGAVEEAERVRGLASSVRDLVSARRLPVLEEEGLVAAAEWLAESLQDRTGITIDIALDGWDGARQPETVERAAYRVLQLALDNVVRHSGAACATIGIRGTASSLVLSVEDAGAGIEATETGGSRGVHLGLLDMRAEADAIGASLSIEPRLPRGTTVRMKWHA